ncbi:MAG: lipoprotein-releasing ABC transporter permease subunit [Nevskia sp.]|nr:lipoprotein-releasing ABC transporter permease subunit [Nevskia sp.]
MRNPYELFTGLRYTRAKRRTRFISFISLTSIICIALGVATLITVMSVMNGFERELRDRTLGMASHATISGNEQGLADWPAVAAQAAKNPEVVGTAPYIDGQAMLRQGGALSGVLLRGILPAEERKVADVGDHIVAGDLDALKGGAFSIVIGAELAETLGVDIGDKVDLMIPQASVTPAGVLPRFRRFTVGGIFRVGQHEFDSGLVLINLNDAQALYRMGDRVTGVRLKLRDMFKAPLVVRQIARDMPQIYYISDWTRQHANFFKAVATEKTVMFLILSLLVGIAAFNIVSTLVMVVQEKQSDIAILRTLGATPRSVMMIFMVQGTLIGFAGTFAGVALGITLALNVEALMPILQAVTGHQFLDPSIYYISDLPSELVPSDVIKIGSLSLALGLLSTLYPAWRASRVQPAEALRYE